MIVTGKEVVIKHIPHPKSKGVGGGREGGGGGVGVDN